MSEERGTVQLPNLEHSGASIILYEYITGRDKRAIESIYLDQAQISSKTNSKDKSGSVEISGVSGSVNQAMQDCAIKCVVKEIVTKSGEKITDEKAKLDFILDLRDSDYDEVIKAINAITDPKKAQPTL